MNKLLRLLRSAAVDLSADEISATVTRTGQIINSLVIGEDIDLSSGEQDSFRLLCNEQLRMGRLSERITQ